MAPALSDWPFFGWSDDVRQGLARALERGPAALATIVGVEGGGPRPVGAQMVIGDGVVEGYLSGGCIEADIARHAQAVLADGRPLTLVYGQGSPWPDIRLPCGARLEIFLEALAPGDAAAARLVATLADRRPAWWMSDGWLRACLDAPPAKMLWPAQVVRPFAPLPRLVVVGGDPIALAIAQLGLLSGFDTHLVRAKGPLQGPGLAGLAYHRGEPLEAFAAIGGLDAWTHLAVCSHDADADHPVLLAALASPAAYVGVLGARRRLGPRLAALEAAGLEASALARLRAPIGLPLGGKAPFEVAIAVLAEIVAERHASAPALSIARGRQPEPADRVAYPPAEWPALATAPHLAFDQNPGRRP